MRNEMALDSEHRVPEAICFHAQQAAEKLLKAYLVEKNVEFGKTHNLQILQKRCCDLDKDFQSIDVGELSDYAVEIRYPDDFFTPMAEEGTESARLAEAIKEFVFAKLTVTETEVRNYSA